MSSPLVSVIIPVYNAAGVVTAMAESLRAQSLRDFELILIDDGSTDATINRLRGIKKNDPRIIVRSKKNGGPSSARNDGLAKASGKYILFLDADDIAAPSLLEKLVGEMERTDAELVSCGWRIDLRTNDNLVNDYKRISPEPQLVSGTPDQIRTFVTRSIGQNGQLYNLWNKLFRRDIIERHSIRFRDDLRFGEDLLFSLEYFKHVSRLALIPDVLYYYQTNSQTSVFGSSSLKPEYRSVNAQALDDFVGEKRNQELDDLYHWVKWRWLLSYAALVSGSSGSEHDKRSMLDAADFGSLKVAPNARFIGRRKWAIERALLPAHRSPKLLLAYGRLFHRAKLGVRHLKTIRQR